MTEPGDYRVLPSFEARVSDDMGMAPEVARTGSGMVPLELSNPKDDHGRRWWNVHGTKIAYAERDVARRVMPNEAAAADRGFMPILSASDSPDDDAQYPVGSPTAYCLRLTDAEAEMFRAASNALGVALDRAYYPERAVEEGPHNPNA